MTLSAASPIALLMTDAFSVSPDMHLSEIISNAPLTIATGLPSIILIVVIIFLSESKGSSATRG